MVTHRLNARNGRVFWDLVGVRAAIEAALASALDRPA